MTKESKLGLTVKKENFSEWFTQVIQKAELIEYTDISGCLVFRPNSYAIWEKVKVFFDEKIKNDGVKNAYFPLLIPEKLLNKESKHIEGFSPEVAWVTQTGNTNLKERLAIRPTSETIIYDSYRKWIRSWKDLPLKINQWCNVVRWEFNNPIPFLRTREFLWQEGHTVFATKKEAEAEAKTILKFYVSLFEDLYAVPVLKGRKSDKEKFAGADYTLTVEVILSNGKAVQSATFHHLGQNFSKPFDIKFLDQNEKIAYGWQNSWGVSTRSLGVMFAVHGDDKGLVLPPRVAPNKVVIIPILFKKDKNVVLKASKAIANKLQKYNAILDDREDYSPGWKYNEWELKGIPIRIELGPRDLKNKEVIVVRRDSNKKITIKEKNLVKEVDKLLESIQKDMLNKARKELDKRIIKTANMSALKKVITDQNIALAYWDGTMKSEESIKDQAHGAKILCIPFNQPKKLGKCIFSGKHGKYQVYIAKSY